MENLFLWLVIELLHYQNASTSEMYRVPNAVLCHEYFSRHAIFAQYCSEIKPSSKMLRTSNGFFMFGTASPWHSMAFGVGFAQNVRVMTILSANKFPLTLNIVKTEADSFLCLRDLNTSTKVLGTFLLINNYF